MLGTIQRHLFHPAVSYWPRGLRSRSNGETFYPGPGAELSMCTV